MRAMAIPLAAAGLVSLAAIFFLGREGTGAAPPSRQEPRPSAATAPLEPMATPAPGVPPTGFIRVDEVLPGMRGYGLSVFSGTQVERFDVEVVSILKRYFGDKDVILIRVGHPVTDHANVIAGMSGSPIYLEGRLAGALALGFTQFAKDPLAGVTPIEYMAADKSHPVEDEHVFVRPIPKDSPFQVLRTPLFAGGLPPAALKDLKDFAEPLGLTVVAGAAGRVDLPQDPKLEPGAAVGLTLLRGDIELEGVGTVTHVSGKDVLVFGHSMMMGGQIELPMTTAYVHAVIASQMWSYKLASVHKPVGCFLQDRLTSVYGVLDRPAPMIPLTVEIENPATQRRKTYRFEMGRHPVYTPFLVTRVPDYCLMLAEAGDGKDQTIHYDLKLKFEGLPPVEIKDAYVDSPMAFGPRGFAQTIFDLIGNPFRKVRLENAHVTLSVVHRRMSAKVAALWLQTQKVRPGDTLKLTAFLRPYDKEFFKEAFEVPIPRALPDGEYELVVMGGREAGEPMDMESLMQMVLMGGMRGMSQAESFEELLQDIRRRHSANRILVRMDLPSLGLRHKDHRLENLPGSVFVNLVASPSAGIRMERNRLEVTRDTGWVIEGRRTARFEVRTPGKVAEEEKP